MIKNNNITLCHLGLKWIQMDQRGLNGRNGPKWTDMNCIDRIGPKWTELNQNGLK